MSSSQASATGQFNVSNGQIIDPNGNAFVARGLNVGPDTMGQATPQTLKSLFPGINFVRFATNYDSSAASMAQQQSYITSLTQAGIVVEVEDHPYPSPGTFTGAQLASESAWYAGLASTYASNPYVWFGSMNEPNTGSYGASEAAISTQEVATYNAIRGAGSSAMIMMELYGGGNPGTIGANFGMTASSYASMTNIAWDYHSYGWTSNYSTDPAAVKDALLGSASGGYGIAAAQTITSANGIVPVIVGEFGDSSIGATVDGDGTQVVSAVLNSGFGYAAWTFGGSGGADQLTQNGALTSYGQQVAAGIKASAAAAGPSTPPAPPTPASANNTIVTAGSTAAIVDASGNKWTITSAGQVALNGTADTTTGSVIELAYVNGAVWQENTAGLWWDKASPTAAWVGGTATSPLPVAPPPPTPASANNTIVKAGSTAAIVDASGNKWTITSAGQVALNGTADTTTGSVIELAYVNGAVWQENSAGLWWDKTSPTAAWVGGTATSPLPVAPPPPPPAASPNYTGVLDGSSATIVDATGNKWSINSAHQVAVNGVADTTTANVTELAYVNKTVYQENASNLWWGKASPTAAWTGGTSTSPLPSSITIPATQTSATISLNSISIVSTSGNHMIFITGKGDTVTLAGGNNTVTDTGSGNTYVIPAAGKGIETFANNILTNGDVLDLRTALAATNWTGSATTLSKYLSVADTATGANLSIAPTSGGAGTMIAAINGATTANLTTLLAHSLT